MIDPKELRIGNLVEWCSEDGEQEIVSIRPNSVVAIDFGYRRKYSGTSKDIDPIPITPEWLERLGFERPDSILPVWGIGRKGDNPLEFRDYDLFLGVKVIYPDGHLELERIQPLRTYKYVHQLQNLYHALTGQELTVKELTPSI